MLTAGIDVGSLSGEVVILLDKCDVLAYSIVPTGANSRRAAEKALQEALQKSGLDFTDIGYLVATGYGRISVEFAPKKVTEITCYARGLHHLYPQGRTIIDIGGQDSKAIRINAKGRVQDFIMNDKCAAGTGRFLEVMARALEVELSQLGALSQEAEETIPISSMCTVFAESEVVSLIAAGHPRENIIRGLHEAIASRTLSMLKRIGIEKPLAMAGGVAKNLGVVRCLEEKLGAPLFIPEEPQIVGALGAALLAAEALEAQEVRGG